MSVEFPVVALTDDGDEKILVSVEGEQVGVLDHETFGWYGMEKAVTLLFDLADQMGFSVENDQNLV